MRSSALLAATIGGMTLVGCASVRPRESFEDVRADVATLVPFDVVWDDGGVASVAAKAKVDALLARPLTIDGAVQVALLSNRELQATYETLGIAQADVVEAGLLANPVFDGSVRLRHVGENGPTIDLAVAFDFLDAFFIPLRKRVAAAQLDSTKADVTAAVLSHVAATRHAYLDVQAAQQTLELRRQVAAATTASFDLAQRLHDAGNNRAIDVLNEQSLREESRLALAMAESDVTRTREALNRQLGLFGPATQWTVDARMPEPTAQEIVGDDVERRVVVASLSLKSQAAAVDAAFGELNVAAPLGPFRSAEIGASAERQDGVWEVGPALSMPIAIFNQNQPTIARAAARLRQSRDRYFAAAVDVRSAAREAWVRVASLRQQVDFYHHTMLPLRAAVVSETQLQYNAMQVGAFGLLQAKRDQIEAGRAYVALLADYWTAKSDLDLWLAGYGGGEGMMK